MLRMHRRHWSLQDLALTWMMLASKFEACVRSRSCPDRPESWPIHTFTRKHLTAQTSLSIGLDGWTWACEAGTNLNSLEPPARSKDHPLSWWWCKYLQICVGPVCIKCLKLLWLWWNGCGSPSGISQLALNHPMPAMTASLAGLLRALTCLQDIG